MDIETAMRKFGPVVRKLAKKHARGTTLSLPDLHQEGYLGIVKALSTFNPNRGTNLETHVSKQIQYHLLEAVRSYYRQTRLRTNKWQTVINKILHAQKMLKTQGQMPSIERLSERTGLRQEKVRHALALNEAKVVSINQPVADKGKEVYREPEYEDKEMRQLTLALALEQGIKKLSEREAQIIRKHYFEDKSIKEIAAEHGVTSSAITRVHMIAIRKLHEMGFE